MAGPAATSNTIRSCRVLISGYIRMLKLLALLIALDLSNYSHGGQKPAVHVNPQIRQAAIVVFPRSEAILCGNYPRG